MTKKNYLLLNVVLSIKKDLSIKLVFIKTFILIYYFIRDVTCFFKLFPGIPNFFQVFKSTHLFGLVIVLD